MVNLAVRLFSVLVLLALVPTGRADSHVSYVLYYGLGDGTVSVVDPSTGEQTASILPSATNAETVFVHWFAYDWRNHKMYVIYSDDPSGTLLLGETDPRQWHIKPIGAIGPLGMTQVGPNEYIFYGNMRGLAYSQQIGSLVMAGANAAGFGFFKLDPDTARLGDALMPVYAVWEITLALTNDPAGNVFADHTDDDGAVSILGPSGGYLVRWFEGLHDPDGFPEPDGSWSHYYDSATAAVAIHPEDEKIYAVLGRSLVVLKRFTYTYPTNHTVTLIRIDNVIKEDFASFAQSGPGPNDARSLVFAPWWVTP